MYWNSAHESKWPSAQIDYDTQQLGTAVSKTSSPTIYQTSRWCSQVCPSKKDGQEQHKDDVVLLHVMLGLRLGRQTANVHVKYTPPVLIQTQKGDLEQEYGFDPCFSQLHPQFVGLTSQNC